MCDMSCQNYEQCHYMRRTETSHSNRTRIDSEYHRRKRNSEKLRREKMLADLNKLHSLGLKVVGVDDTFTSVNRPGLLNNCLTMMEHILNVSRQNPVIWTYLKSFDAVLVGTPGRKNLKRLSLQSSNNLTTNYNSHLVMTHPNSSDSNSSVDDHAPLSSTICHDSQQPALSPAAIFATAVGAPTFTQSSQVGSDTRRQGHVLNPTWYYSLKNCHPPIASINHCSARMTSDHSNWRQSNHYQRAVNCHYSSKQSIDTNTIALSNIPNLTLCQSSPTDTCMSMQF